MSRMSFREGQMGSQVELKAGVAQFRIDLSDFVDAMRRLIGAAVGANEKERARDAMRVLLAESGKTFKMVVETLAPVYALNDKVAFAKQFDSLHERIKRLYLGRATLFRTHCSIVETEFDKLQQRRSWMTHLVVAQQAYQDLKNVCDRWLFQDWNIVSDIESFLDNLNKFIDEIAVLKRTNTERAFETLQAGLKPIENDFLAMQTKVGELDVLGREM
jgi:hypothetical protein